MHYGVIGEDKSDVEVLRHIIERLSPAGKKVVVRTKGYNGCAEMLRKGAKQLMAFEREQCHRFVVCYDSDREDPAQRLKRLISDVIKPAAISGPLCALVPIQEIEAWILADLPAVTNIIQSWVPTEKYPSPENVKDPKEELVKLSRNVVRRPRYSYVMHNPQVAKFLDLDVVYRKCISFRPLADLVRTGKANV
ncbi:hypothetical protein N234_06702 [Ralstonia pickettii DTP0602]|nr:hypothetical protein N234_06702 [Ralstonia pickettii DTP0602]